MAIFEMSDSMDETDVDQTETVVSVHSPVMNYNHRGNLYTVYSVSLKSNHTSFSQSYSCVNRRYSEFVQLRNLLIDQHPSIVPPSLPPKKLFSRFDQSFINDRAAGLQNFLVNVIKMPVYLSNKGVHLFLQSRLSMIEIDLQVKGEVPAPKLMTPPIDLSLNNMACFSDTSSENTDSASSISDFDDPLPSISEETDNQGIIEVGFEAKDLLLDETDEDEPFKRPNSAPIPILQPHLRRSLLSQNGSPIYSTSDPLVSRRVSFCDKVTVAVVRDKFWNIGTRPIRNETL